MSRPHEQRHKYEEAKRETEKRRLALTQAEDDAECQLSRLREYADFGISQFVDCEKCGGTGEAVSQ